MELVHINIICLQVRKGSLQFFPEALRRHRTCLRGDIDFITHSLKRQSQLVLAVRIVAGAVKVRDAALIRPAQDFYGLLIADSLHRKRTESILICDDSCFSKVLLSPYHSLPYQTDVYNPLRYLPSHKESFRKRSLPYDMII